MYVLGSNLNQVGILSLQTGQVVGKISGQIIEPASLELLALTIEIPKSPPAVVLVRDTRRITAQAVVIDSIEDISDPEDIVRLKATIDRKFKLEGIKVVSESARKLGTVTDYTIGLKTNRVQKLYVKPSWLKQIFSSNLMIDRSQIVDVSNDKITVRDATVARPVMVPGVKTAAAK